MRKKSKAPPAFERARSEEQKEQRVATIVSAAERLFDRHEFEELTLAAIAREASFTRSNLYKYFQTREEILLELLKRDMRRWARLICERLAGRRYGVKRVAQLWAESLGAEKRLLRLLALLHVQLEKSCSLESLISFKALAQESMGELTEALCKTFKGLHVQRAEEFLAVQIATASGLYGMTHLTDKQKRAAEAAGFYCYDGLFVELFARSVAHGLQGALGAE